MMLKALLVVGMTLTPALGLACSGSKSAQAETTPAAVAKKDPSACAKGSGLVGSGCSYTTGMMAQRVLTEGASWTFTGSLVRTENELASHVAAPYSVGPEGRVHVVANEILEELTQEGLEASRVALEGMRLDVDGVTYFVVTGFQAAQS